MRIPLPRMMRHFREEEFKLGKQSGLPKLALRLWAWAAARPALYHFGARLGVGALKVWGMGRGRLTTLPLAGGWTAHRDLAVPEGGTFQAQWAAGKRPIAAKAASPGTSESRAA